MRDLQNNKNKKHLSKDKVVALISAITLISTSTAIVSGTLAWFTYATHAYTSYEGTTIGDSGELEIGIRSSRRQPTVEAKFKEWEEKDGSYIYWTNESLTPDMLQPFLADTGTAIDTLYPVTTGAYSSGTPSFYKAPGYLKNYTGGDSATFDSYQTLKLAFRVKAGDAGSTYETNKSIYLGEASFESSSEIYKATRFYANNGSSEAMIAPARSDGKTLVGGILDLNGDGLYDSYLDETDHKQKEYVYGQYDSVEYKDTPNAGETPLPEEDKSTFNANHQEGTYSLKESCEPKYVSYKSMDNYKVGKTPIAVTSSIDGYAYLDFVTFVEGWDKSVIEKNKGTSFNLTITFEIDS